MSRPRACRVGSDGFPVIVDEEQSSASASSRLEVGKVVGHELSASTSSARRPPARAHRSSDSDLHGGDRSSEEEDGERDDQGDVNEIVAVEEDPVACAEDPQAAPNVTAVTVNPVINPHYYSQDSTLRSRLSVAIVSGGALIALIMLLAYKTDFEQDLLMRSARWWQSVRSGRPSPPHLRLFDDRAASGATTNTSGGPAMSSSESAEAIAAVTGEEFDRRLREMVSRFWAPTSRTARHHRHRSTASSGPRLQETAASAASRIPPERRKHWGPPRSDAVDSDDDEEEGVSQPPPDMDRINWFLVQLRRRHDRLPAPGNGSHWEDDYEYDDDGEDVEKLL